MLPRAVFIEKNCLLNLNTSKRAKKAAGPASLCVLLGDETAAEKARLISTPEGSQKHDFARHKIFPAKKALFHFVALLSATSLPAAPPMLQPFETESTYPLSNCQKVLVFQKSK